MNTITNRILSKLLSLSIIWHIPLSGMTRHNIDINAASTRAEQFAQSMAAGQPITVTPQQLQTEEPVGHTTIPPQVKDIMQAYTENPWEHVEAFVKYDGIISQRLLKINDANARIKRITVLKENKLACHFVEYIPLEGAVQQIAILDISTGNTIATKNFRGDIDDIIELTAQKVAVIEGGSNKMVHIWNLSTDHIHPIFDKPERNLRSIIFFSEAVLALHYQHAIRLFDCSNNTFKPIELSHDKSEIRAIGRCLDGSIFFYDEHSVYIWDPTKNKIMDTYEMTNDDNEDAESIQHVKQLPDKSYCIFVSDATGILYLYRLFTQASPTIQFQVQKRVPVNRSRALIDRNQSLLIYSPGNRCMQITDKLIAINKLKNVELYYLSGKIAATFKHPDEGEDDLLHIFQLSDKSICAYSTKAIYRWSIDKKLLEIVVKELVAGSFKLMSPQPQSINIASPKVKAAKKKLNTTCVIQ